MSYFNRRYLGTLAAPGIDHGIPVAVNPSILASNIQLMRVMNELNQADGSSPSKDPSDPSITSDVHDRMLFRTFLMDALLGGTETMRAAGKTLLPMYTAEKQTDWQTRLSQAVLFNYTERTSSDLSGRLFKTPPKVPTIQEGMPPDLELHFKDVDGEQTGLLEFIRQWFRRGFDLGLYHVIVNTPKAGTTSAADRKTPTWSFIHPDNIIFAHQGKRPDGSKYIDHLRVMGCTKKMVGYTEVEVKTITVYEPNMISVFEYVPKARTKIKWMLVERFETDWDEVPLVTFYSNKIGFMEAIPPLQDLAFLNVRHWQSYSDQVNILTVARFPILAGSGIGSGRGSTTIAPRKMFRIPDANGKLVYVEHTGAAINSGKDDLEMLEHMMSNYGSEFLKTRPGSTAATSRALDSAESTSTLNGMANAFEDAVHQLLVMTMKSFERFKPEDVVPRIEFVVDLSISQSDSTELSTLDLARRRRDISRKAYLKELARRDILADTFNEDDDWKQVQEEVEIEKEMGLLKDENQDAIPTAQNAQKRAASGKSARGKPVNGKSGTGEGDPSKDQTLS